MFDRRLMLSHLQHKINEGSGGQASQLRKAENLKKLYNEILPIASYEDIKKAGLFSRASPSQKQRAKLLQNTLDATGKAYNTAIARASTERSLGKPRANIARSKPIDPSVPRSKMSSKDLFVSNLKSGENVFAQQGRLQSGIPSEPVDVTITPSHKGHQFGHSPRQPAVKGSVGQRPIGADVKGGQMESPDIQQAFSKDTPPQKIASLRSRASKLGVNIPRGQISSGMMKGLAGGIAGLGVGALADIGTRKALQAAGVENETAQDVAGTMAGGVAGGAAGSVAAGLGAGAGAAAGAAGAAGALGGWYAARGILKAADKLTGSDLSQQKTNPVEIAADYMKDRRRDQEVDKAEKERLARAASPEGQKRKAQMAAILRGETPEL